MKSLSLFIGLLLLAIALPLSATERMIAGHDRQIELLGVGAKETVTSPGRIASEIGQDVGNFGVGGLVTGAAAGSVKAAGQAAKGAGKMLIGLLDIFTKPLRESRYANVGPGRLRKSNR